MSGTKSSADAPPQARAPKVAPVVRPLSGGRETDEPTRTAKGDPASAKAGLPVTEELPFLPASTTARAPIAHTTAPSTPLSRDRVVLAALAIVVTLLAVTLWVRSRQQSGVAAAQGVASPATPDAGAQNTAVPSAAPKPAVPQAPSAAPTNTNPAPALVAGATDDDRAFYVLTNKFTVRLAQYDNDANAKKLAFEAYKYLRTEGVPAVQPIVSGDGAHIFLCAGAQPKKDDLAELTAWCVKLRGPSATSKKLPFSGAYVDNIDHVLKRN